MIGLKPTDKLSPTAQYRLRYPERRILQGARRRAEKYGLPFDLTEEDIEIPDVCPALGIPLIQATGRATDNSPSLDRIEPEKGYIKTNVRVISNRANVLKRDATWAELKKLARYMETHDYD